ncbi:hypothetical protein RZS08_53695, partial [Arthrospira platensis SPKY1]|nr:hypothetical protein [Arthrospira platensis SPKY1]
VVPLRFPTAAGLRELLSHSPPVARARVARSRTRRPVAAACRERGPNSLRLESLDGGLLQGDLSAANRSSDPRAAAIQPRERQAARLAPACGVFQ